MQLGNDTCLYCYGKLKDRALYVDLYEIYRRDKSFDVVMN